MTTPRINATVNFDNPPTIADIELGSDGQSIYLYCQGSALVLSAGDLPTLLHGWAEQIETALEAHRAAA